MRAFALSATEIFVSGSSTEGALLQRYDGPVANPVRVEGGGIMDVWGTNERIFWVNDLGVHSVVRIVPW